MRRFFSVHDVSSLPALMSLAHIHASSPLLHHGVGKHKTLGLLFFNPSLRTRMSSQKAAFNLGMEVIVMNVGGDAWTLETRDGVVMDGAAAEHIRDAAAVMGQYCDIIGVRSFASLTDRDADYKEEVLESFARYCGVPVVSLESATRHPLQSFADVITIESMKPRPRPRVVLTWAPHPKALPQAVPNSFAEWCRAMNYDLVIAHPPGYELHEEFTKGVEIAHDQDAALRGADFVYAKNWSSYQDYGAILSRDTAWTVSAEKMKHTNAAKFMHCLPVRRNMIVTDEVIDSPNSIIIKEAANRVVSMQTILHLMLTAASS